MSARIHRFSQNLENWLLAIRQSLGSAFTYVAAVLLGIAGPPWKADSIDWLFYASCVIASVGAVFQLRRRPTYGQLVRQLEQRDSQAKERAKLLEDSVEILLETLAESLSVDFTTSRISAYYHIENPTMPSEPGYFVLLRRWSQSTTLAKPGRPKYPDNQGVIGSAWDIPGGKLVTSLPRKRELWEDALVKRFNFDRETTERLAMQSRSLLARRVDTVRGQPMAIIVIESTENKGIDGKTQDQLDTSVLWKALSRILESGNPHFPSLNHSDVE